MALKPGSPLRRPRYTSGNQRCAVCDYIVRADDEVYDPRRTARSRSIVHEKCALFIQAMRRGHVHLTQPDHFPGWVQLSLFAEYSELRGERADDNGGITN